MELNYISLDDAELIKIAIFGDANAFEELYNRHYKYIYKFVLRTIKNVEAANDITQDTFIIFFRKMTKFDFNLGSVKIFMRSIAVKEMLRYRRINRSEFEIEFDVENLENININISTVIIRDIVEELEKNEKSKKISEIVSKLPEKYSIPLILYVYDECTDEEISIILEMPISTIKTRRRRAKKILKQWLSPILDLL